MDELNSDFSSNYEDEEPGQEDDFDDPFKIHETCNHDLEDYEDLMKKGQNDSGCFSTNSSTSKFKSNCSIRLDDLFSAPSLDLSSVTTTTASLANAFDSDDSDSLFSITKSVSVQSLMKKNYMNKSRTHLVNGERRLNAIKNRKRKKRLKNKIPGLFENEEFEEEDDEDELDERTDINELDLNGKQRIERALSKQRALICLFC